MTWFAAGHALLYAPDGYVRASPEVRRKVVNGCGTSGWKGAVVPETLWGLNVSAACNIHDWMYAEGTTISDKGTADRTFLNNMLRIIDAAGGPWLLKTLRRRRAKTYYEAVHVFGGPAFWHEKNDKESTITVMDAAIAMA